MISLAGVAVEFGTQELYRNVDLFVGATHRIGLVGPNGSGKSTILKLMGGLQEPSQGQVDIRRGTRVAYLPQTGAVASDRTVLEEAMSAFSHLDEMHERMIDLEHRMKDANLSSEELKAVLDEYGELQHHHGADGYDRHARAEKVLGSLGFAAEDFPKPVRTQSGGFQVRLTLARMLLEDPDVLLLDEPTNYLDIRSIEWLENYLTDFKGAVVMVAHDRYLMDRLVRKLWAIESRRVLVFPGNYSDYLRDKEQRDERRLKEFEEQQALIKRTEHFIAKFKGRKDTAKRAMSRQKMLDRMELVEAPETLPVIRIRFPEADEVYGKAFELKGVFKSFGSNHVLHDVSMVIRGGERVGLFGANGQGKTTLLRIIAGSVKPDKGHVWRSQKTAVAYYEQGAEELLDDGLSVLEAAAQAGGGFTENELKGILGIFLFSGDAVDKRVGVLSGGERSRLAIIRALLTPSNLLILDEPTNHLDIQSREILFEAISRYRRTVVFAAHDRFMLDKLADKTIRVEDGHALLFPGNFSYATSVARTGAEHRRQPAAAEPASSSPRPERKPTGQTGRRAGTARAAMDPLARIRQRLVEIDAEYEQARQSLDLNLVRALSDERRGLLLELEARKADEVETGEGR